MRADLANLRKLSAYLKRTEIKFDLTSSVTELQKQIAQEFDFRKVNVCVCVWSLSP